MCLWLVRGYLLVTRILFICTWGTQESHVGICTDIVIMLSWRFLCNFVDMSCWLYWMLCVQVVTKASLKDIFRVQDVHTTTFYAGLSMPSA
jgi:hypothetical protein